MENTRGAIRRMVTALNKIDELYYQMARAAGTKDNLLALLYALDDGAAHTQKQICQEWLIPKTTLNTVVKECVEAGYIQLERHFREKTIQLTPAGKIYAKGLLDPLYATEERAMESVLEHHSPAFVEALERFAGAFQAEFDQIKQGEKHIP